MRKTIYYSMIILAGLFFAACSKDKPVVPNDPTEESTGITLPETISVAIPDNLTRVSLTQDEEDADGAVKLAWDEDDKIYVADHAANNKTWITYEIDTPLGENPHVATFHRVGDEITASSFDIFYGAPSLAMAESIDFSVQTQEGNANTDHLQYMALISGVNTVENVQFSSDWATEKGGHFKQSGIVRLRLQMPANVTAVSSVFLAASSAVFNTTNKLDGKKDMIKVDFESDVDISADHIVTVYANLPWEDVSVSDGVGLTVVVKTSDGYYYSKDISNASGLAFSTGSVNAIKLSRSGFGVFAGGTGVDGDPYTIATKWHMMNTKPRTVANAGSVTYFKLLNDIDMSGLYWIPLNNVASDGKYTQYISFDGNNCTISNLATDPTTIPDYPSLFGVLQGSVKNLTIDHATITPGGKKSGVFAGYIGTGSDYKGEKTIDNVHVTNSTVKSGTNYCGGFAAQMNLADYSITNCSVEDTEVVSSGYAAGFITYIGQEATVSDIVVKGTDVKSTGHANSNTIPTDGFAGGIAARVADAVDFDRCTYQNGTILGPTLTKDNANSELARYVGGLIGYVDNAKAATFDDCHVKSATIGLVSAPGTNNGRYVGGAFGHLGTAAVVGDVTGCTVESLTTKETVRNYVAGFVSYLEGGTIKNSSASSAAAIGNETYSGAAGGFVGYCVGGLLYNNTTSVSVQGAGNPGGFVGWVDINEVRFEKCSASGDVKATSNNAGGFAGIVKVNSSFIECSSTGKVESTAGYVGGLIGYINADRVSVSKCYSTSSVTASGNYVGGLVGVSESDTIEKCYYEGTVSGNSRVGGILGISLKNDAVIVSDCYSRGKVIGATGEQRFGGIVGDLGMSGKVTNCWSDATVSGGRVCGGIVGLACLQTWADNTNSDNTVLGCIAWNPSVTAAQQGDYGSSAAIVGHTSFKNILSACYRHPDMVYVNSNNTLASCLTTQVDQPDSDGTNWVAGTTPGTTASSNQNPYYGVAAASEDTVSSIAQTLGWDNNIWDFTGDLPTLK